MPTPNLEFTGERLVPGKVDIQLLEEHLARYQYAVRILKAHLPEGARVVDLACGAGYGTRMLAESGFDALGLDIGADAIDYAQQVYGSLEGLKGRLAYVLSDVTHTGLSEGTFPGITAFEILEHLEHPEELLQEIRRLLAPGGIAVVSTPHKGVYQAGGENHFHFQEYTLPEFKALLEEAFPDWTVELVGQRKIGMGGLPAVAAMRKRYIALKRALGIGPILRKRMAEQDPNSSFLDRPHPYLFTPERVSGAEYFVATLRRPA
ncbi:MAG TPA: class I SAM-dependent methyltransferase [bacterium]|nr:class I SAM-dependent methyltransferase [bacterium]